MPKKISVLEEFKKSRFSEDLGSHMKSYVVVGSPVQGLPQSPESILLEADMKNHLLNGSSAPVFVSEQQYREVFAEPPSP